MIPAIAFSQYTVYPNPATVNLGTAGNFRILAGSAISIGIGCTVTGDVGVFPTDAFTNLGSLIGTAYVVDIGGVASAAKSDLTIAYNEVSARTPVNATLATELGGQILGRGVYDAGTFTINGVLTLDGAPGDIFIFKSAATLITGATCVMTLTGGAVWSNVFWQVTSSATIEGDFKGNILALTAITQNVGASSIINGRALAWNAAVTVNGNSVLPVELASFTATANRTNADLHWSTAMEVNNYGFEIERRLVNRNLSLVTGNWEKIGFVEGNGTSNSAYSYSYTDASVSSGTYAYRLKQIDNDGTYKYSSEAEITIAVPKVVALNQNYPNPFNPTTTITFTLEQDGFTTLKIYDVLGREVTTLVNGEMKSGVVNTVSFNASKLSSGVYFSRLEAGPFVSTTKLILMK